MQYYQGFDMEFLDWTSKKNEKGVDPDELNAIMFDGVLPHPELFNGKPEKGRSKYPDPIYENVLHVHSLLRDWDDAKPKSNIEWRKYVDARRNAPSPKASEGTESADKEKLSASDTTRESFFSEYFLLG
jgi:hypothetical protein